MSNRTQRLVELLAGPRREEIAQAFWRKVRKADPQDCWLWTGYGRASYGMLEVLGWGLFRATHVAWVLEHGTLDPSLWMLHSCDNPPCVNVLHLRPGTARDNTMDMIARPVRVTETERRTGYASRQTLAARAWEAR